jgi:HEPN domain-containing protein
VELAQTCRKWPALILEAEELTPYAITTRYPGEDEPVSADEAGKAIAVAEKVRHLIRHALLEEGIDPD